MKERQRWQAEEDALLCAYVRQYGPREWHLVSQRMCTSLNRDPKACLERWKNYLRPGIKKGSLTEEEQHLVIRLQAKHGNKWKKIAAEVPGRTAKRLGKWWEVFKEKQRRGEKDTAKVVLDLDQRAVVDGKYNHILETFAEKIVKQHSERGFLMATSKGQFVNADPPAHSPPTVLPPWLSSSSMTMPVAVRPPSPSVALTLSPSVVPSSPGVPWLHHDNVPPAISNNSLPMSRVVLPPAGEKSSVVYELLECCKELEEKRCALVAHKKEAAWRLRRVELQLESEKACKRMEKMEEIEAKVKALREEQKTTLDRIEAEYREQLAGFRRDAEAKEQKLAEQWAAKHSRLTVVLEQMGCQAKYMEPNGQL